MPEGFSSIADLKVEIAADSEKLKGGLSVANAMVSRFASEGAGGFKVFDAAVGKASAAVLLLKSRLGLILTAIEFAVGLVGSLEAYGREAAELTGTEKEFDKVREAAEKLTAEMRGGLVIAAADVFDATSQMASAFVGADASVTAIDANAQGLAKTLQGALAEGLSGLTTRLERLRPLSQQSAEALELGIKGIEEAIANLKANLDSGPGVFENLFGGDENAWRAGLKARIAALEEAQVRHRELLASEREINAAFEALGPAGGPEADEAIESLDRQAVALERQVAVLGLAADAAAKYRAEMEVFDKTDTTRVDSGQRRVLDEIIERIRAATEAQEKFNAAKKVEAEQKQKATARDNVFAGVDKEVSALEAKARTVGLTAFEAAKLLKEEQLLAALREQNIALGDEERAKIAAKADAYAKASLAAQALADAERKAAAGKKVVEGIDKEIGALEAKARGLGRTAFEAAKLAKQEQLLAAYREQGIAVGDAERAIIEAKAEAYAGLTAKVQEVEEANKKLAEISREIGGVLSTQMEQAFEQWTTTGKVSVKDMTEAILADFQRILLRKAVLEPLFGGGQQGGGALGQILASFNPQTSGGGSVPARARGGPVARNRPYLVGEEGPELFVPDGAGQILPNLSSGGRRGSPFDGAGGQGQAANVQVNVINNAKNTEVEQRTRAGTGGVRITDIVIKEMNAGIARGDLDSALGARFGARRRTAVR